MEATGTKYGLLSKHLFERTQQHDGCTKPQGNDLFMQKILSAVITWNKKDSSKQVVSMINKLGKEFFAAATFKGS